jgi:hypothetical protein
MSRRRKGGRLAPLACLVAGQGLCAVAAHAQATGSLALALAEGLCAEPQFIELVPWVTGQPFAFSEGLGCLPSADQLSEPTIDWGDSTTSPGVISNKAAGSATVGGQHTYSRPGSFHVSVQLTDDTTGQTLTRGWHTEVEVSEGPVARPSAPPAPSRPSSPVDPSPPPGVAARVAARSASLRARVDKRRRGAVAVLFTSAPATSLRARIFWGDGSSSRGLLRGSTPKLRVVGRHRWRHRRRYAITVLVTNARGQSLARVTDHVRVR